MKQSFLIYFSLVATGLCAGPTDRSRHDETVHKAGKFNGLAVAPLRIRRVVDSDAAEKTFNGTIQEIDIQIRRLNPDFSWGHSQLATRRQHKKRRTEKVLCHVQNLPPASRAAVEKNRDWLSSLATELSVDAQRCTKFSCIENAAVWFCNDNLQWIQQNSITIADHIDSILAKSDCATSGNDNFIQGQAFDGSSYNIIVNADHCP
ncbi:uncharacterized protein F4812DRAFT_436578 [Daldinia caldariorum]|uniref:uncharacterized protein n=1 Tax=Daldinia caldariorum TaxID=326644 RepID=UPI002007AE03|nr:uncharacterized protein F4812DRAFT_436578 [Daldinia caldariorum]KAI1466266.1 hypothetical protein F4812DRAFT_436578 [Daldinia caldariorum]